MEQQLQQWFMQSASDGVIQPQEIMQCLGSMGAPCDMPTAMSLMQRIGRAGGMNAKTFVKTLSHYIRKCQGHPAVANLSRYFKMSCMDGRLTANEIMGAAQMIGTMINPMGQLYAHSRHFFSYFNRGTNDFVPDYC